MPYPAPHAAFADDVRAICQLCESSGQRPWMLAHPTFEDGAYKYSVYGAGHSARHAIVAGMRILLGNIKYSEGAAAPALLLPRVLFDEECEQQLGGDPAALATLKAMYF
jgi:hypothetical protein